MVVQVGRCKEGMVGVHGCRVGNGTNHPSMGTNQVSCATHLLCQKMGCHEKGLRPDHLSPKAHPHLREPTVSFVCVGHAVSPSLPPPPAPHPQPLLPQLVGALFLLQHQPAVPVQAHSSVGLLLDRGVGAPFSHVSCVRWAVQSAHPSKAI